MIQGEKLQYFLMNYDICEYKPIKNGALYWTTCSYMSDVTDLRDIFKRGVAFKTKTQNFLRANWSTESGDTPNNETEIF